MFTFTFDNFDKIRLENGYIALPKLVDV